MTFFRFLSENNKKDKIYLDFSLFILFIKFFAIKNGDRGDNRGGFDEIFVRI